MPSTFSLTTEKSVLASLMLDSSLYDIASDVLTEKIFQHPTSRLIYRAIERGSKKGKIDKQVVISELETINAIPSLSYGDEYTGTEVVERLCQMDVNPTIFGTYLNQLVEAKGASMMSEANNEAEEMMARGASLVDIMAFMEAKHAEIATFGEIAVNPVSEISDLVDKFVEDYKRDVEEKTTDYILTGLKFWDDWAGGLKKGRLYILGAFSSDGKSTLAQTIIRQIALEGVEENKGRKKVFYWTAESNREEIIAKFLQMQSGIPQMRIEKRQVLSREKPAFRDALKSLREGYLAIDDSPFIGLPVLRSRIRKAVANGAELIVLDQLDEITVPGIRWKPEQEHLKVNYVAMHIKAIAREEGVQVPIILLHQLNRANEGKKNGKPVSNPQDIGMDALYQGGEKHANAICILRHKRKEQQVIKSYLNWVKMREGQRKSILVGFDMERNIFVDVSQEDFDETDLEDNTEEREYF